MAPGSPAPRWPLSPPSHPTPLTGTVAEQKPPKPGKCPPLERGLLPWPSGGSWGGPWWPCRGPPQEGAWGGLDLPAASRHFHTSGARIWQSTFQSTNSQFWVLMRIKPCPKLPEGLGLFLTENPVKLRGSSVLRCHRNPTKKRTAMGHTAPSPLPPRPLGGFCCPRSTQRP